MQFNQDGADQKGSGVAKQNNKDSPEASAGGAPPPKKKPYVAPVLVPWGTLRDMTKAVGTSGASDGGNSKSSKRATR